jgi:endoglucanase
VQLRGVNVSGLEAVAILGWDPSNPWGGQTGDDTPNWNVIKTWGGAGTEVINAVRLPLNEASWLGLTCVDEGGAGSVVTNGAQQSSKPGASVKADPGGNYQATVAQSVADATAAGLYVILDLHLNAPGSACPNAQNAMADADHSVAFWTSVATAFKANPAVIFELFNEPYLSQAPLVDDTPWADLLNGGGTLTQYIFSGSPSLLNLTWKNDGMQQLLNAVRATGSTNVVLVAPLAYSSALDGWLQYKPTDPAGQMGAVWHAYPADGFPTQVSCVDTGAANTAGNLPGCSAKIMADAQGIVAAGYPVVITEFGDTIGGSGAPWASVLLPFADKSGISYLGWTWDTWSGFSADVLITDEKGTPTQGYGTYVKQHYTCVAAGTANCP